MKINFYSTLRNITGCGSIVFPANETASLLDVLIFLVQEFPGLQAMFFEKNGVLAGQMPLFLNGRNPRLLPDGLETKVEQSDVLSLFAPVASGKMNVERLQQAVMSESCQEGEHEN